MKKKRKYLEDLAEDFKTCSEIFDFFHGSEVQKIGEPLSVSKNQFGFIIARGYPLDLSRVVIVNFIGEIYPNIKGHYSASAFVKLIKSFGYWFDSIEGIKMYDYWKDCQLKPAKRK